MLIVKQVKRQRVFYRSVVILLTVTLFSYSLTGCAGMSPQTKAALYCGAGGALVGAAVGALVDKKNRGTGALIGGAIGAAVAMGACFAIAHYKNREVADYQRTKQETNYQSSSGNVVRITEFSVSPDAVSPGENVTFGTQYYIMTPNPDEDITITETRTIKIYDQASGAYKELGNSASQITMKPGTRRSDGTIKVDNLTPEGKYVIALAVESNGNKAETESPLIITRQPTAGLEPERNSGLLVGLLAQ